jgi:hypothetical protein
MSEKAENPDGQITPHRSISAGCFRWDFVGSSLRIIPLFPQRGGPGADGHN